MKLSLLLHRKDNKKPSHCVNNKMYVHGIQNNLLPFMFSYINTRNALHFCKCYLQSYVFCFDLEDRNLTKLAVYGISIYRKSLFNYRRTLNVNHNLVGTQLLFIEREPVCLTQNQNKLASVCLGDLMITNQ